MQNEDRLRAILSDLGRSTRRGVRKCHKCGTVTGTRGVSCKNRACDVVFTEAGKKKKQSMEVCKLNTGSSTQIFSVRVRDKGPDFRGFVQLPILQPGLDDTESDYISQVSALCFVESCQRLFNTNILKCHEGEVSQSLSSPSCGHIQLAMRCCSDAIVLPIDYKAVQSLSISSDMKNEIWQLNTETPGPLVQRVSRSIMAVKCKVTTKHPLGYLHVTFVRTLGKEVHSICSCNSIKILLSKSDNPKNCIHYYSCIAAFSSDDSFSEEFSQFILKERAPEMYTIEIDPNDDDSNFVEILNNSIHSSEVEVEVLQQEPEFILPELSTELEGLTSSVVDVSSELEAGLSHQALSHIDAELISQGKNKPKKKRSTSKVTSKKTTKKDWQKQIVHSFPFSDDIVDPESTKLSFLNWLASVTERINQAMHYQLNGKPDPLVFHVPHSFFDCFMERITSHSSRNWRKRLPNLVTTFTRRNSPPLGTFYNYTWHITSLLHAKAIFDTPQMPLNVSRSFVEGPSGTYEDLDPTILEEGKSLREGERSIRPVELKTYLKIGNCSSDQESPSLLSIDWTPNVLPITKVGELKITFEFGHTRSPRS